MSTDDTRERILTAAGPIFADKGYGGATVREICQAAAVNQAAINYYFGDKERLYIETVTRAHRLGVQRVPLPKWSADTPPEQRLADFVRTLLERMLGDESPWQARLMLREILQPTSACQELVEDYFRPQFEVLQDILAEMLPAEVPPLLRYQIGFSIVGQCVFYRVAADIVRMIVPADDYRDAYHPEALAAHIARFSLAAIGRSPSLGEASQEEVLSSPSSRTTPRSSARR